MLSVVNKCTNLYIFPCSTEKQLADLCRQIGVSLCCMIVHCLVSFSLYFYLFLPFFFCSCCCSFYETIFAEQVYHLPTVENSKETCKSMLHFLILQNLMLWFTFWCHLSMLKCLKMLIFLRSYQLCTLRILTDLRVVLVFLSLEGGAN